MREAVIAIGVTLLIAALMLAASARTSTRLAPPINLNARTRNRQPVMPEIHGRESEARMHKPETH